MYSLVSSAMQSDVRQDGPACRQLFGISRRRNSGSKALHFGNELVFEIQIQMILRSLNILVTHFLETVQFAVLMLYMLKSGSTGTL